MRCVALLLLLAIGCMQTPPPPATVASTASPEASTIDPGFPRATEPREFTFPADHGQHPPYQTEWWYYTGLLADSAGREYGVQVTMFRRALVPLSDEPRASTWATRDVYLGHVAIADIAAGKFASADQLARGGAGLASASLDDHEVTLLDWQIAPTDEGFTITIPEGPEGLGLALECRYQGPPVLHGETPGLSIKGGPGQASYYYSLPRIPTSGQLSCGGVTAEVSGSLWMDHEFGSNQLSADQVGWDWLALTFEDGSALMLYQLRREDGSPDPSSSGTWIPRRGRPRHLAPDEFTLTPGDTWESPTSRARYPISWTITLPSQDLAIEVRALLDPCELMTERSTGITYWEGPVRATGSHPGIGYLEMTGYAAPMTGTF